MRLLFVAYCMPSGRGGAQIGVYKRALRIALELADRGHDIRFFCTGRQFFHDAHTAEAEHRLRFVDLPFEHPTYDGARRNRATFLAALRSIGPDVVVIGEAPLAGTLLETTLCAVEAGIPAVLLDNTYHPAMVDNFCRRHGAMFDGVILSGPSALHGPSDFGYLAQVPPYLEVSLDRAGVLLGESFGRPPSRLMVVLAYDENVARLGLSLVERLGAEPDFGALFLTPDLAGVTGANGNVRVVPPPTDPVLFGLLKLARLAVTKGGFMQVTEALSLHTPVVGYWYDDDYPAAQLPDVLRAFTHPTVRADADEATVRAARTFLRMEDGARAVHDGRLDAAAKAADFLEAVPPTPRRDASPEAARLGFTAVRMERAIRRLEPRGRLVIQQTRASHLRSMDAHDLHSVVCEYSLDGEARFVRLWGRTFHTRPRVTLELDMGEGLLPDVKAAPARRLSRLRRIRLPYRKDTS
jgi:hypothetical protein